MPSFQPPGNNNNNCNLVGFHYSLSLLISGRSPSLKPFFPLSFLLFILPLILTTSHHHHHHHHQTKKNPLLISINLCFYKKKKKKKKKGFIMEGRKNVDFEDFLPTMADKLGGEGLIGELCNGFQLLMDSSKGLITFESLKRNSVHLGLQGSSDDELRSMLREGDMDGDGALNQMEFCVLMFRLSPDLMDESEIWLEEALQQDMMNE